MPPFNTIVTTPFTLPSYIFANGQVTGNKWSNENNMFLVDGDVASSDPNAGAASDLTVGGYNFQYNGISIPQGAVIVGIEFEVIGYAGAQISPVLTLDISLYDNVNGADDFYPYISGFTGLTPTMSTTLLGTPTYLFASAFSVDQINNLKMNLQANGDISLDSLPVRIYFYIPAPDDEVVIDTGLCIDCDSPIQVQAMYLELPFLKYETKFYLKKGSFSYPNGVPVQPGDVGSCGGHIPFVFDESKRKADGNFEENAVLDTNTGTWTVLPSGVIEVDLFDVTNRGLDYKTPASHSVANMSDHDANSKVIISNNEPYNLTLVRRCQEGTVFSAPIEVLENGIQVAKPVTKFNFLGAGQATTQDGTDPLQVNINIPGAGGTINPIIDTVSSATSDGMQVPDLTWEHTCHGVNRALIVEVSMEGGKTVTGITYNGVAFTFDVADELNGVRSEIWHLVAPALGTHDIVVTFSADSYCSAGAESFVGVDPVTPIGTVQSATGTDNNPLLSLVTLYDNSAIVDGLSTAQTPILYTPGAGQSDNWHRTANTDTRQGGSSIESAGLQPDTITMDYSITQNTDWAYCAVEIKGITFPAGSDDHKVLDTGTDTTPGFLDDKMEIVPGAGVTITKTIQNPGANEKISYQIDAGSTVFDQYQFDDTVGGVPGVGFVTYDDANPALVTIIDVNNLDGLTVDHAAFFATLNAGDTFLLTSIPSPGNYARYTVVSTNNTGGTTQITVTYDISNGTFANNEAISLTFIPQGGQTAIQFDDETGTPLGTPGTVDEVEITGGGVAGTRVGNKVIYTFPAPGGGSENTVNADENISTFYTDMIPLPVGAGQELGWSSVSGSAPSMGNAITFSASTGGSFASYIVIGGNNTSVAPLQFNVGTQVRLKWTVKSQNQAGTNKNGIGFGEIGADVASLTDTTKKKITFTFDDTNINSVCCDGAAVTTNVLQAYNQLQTYILDFIWDPANTQVLFYVNGVLKDTITTNIPTGATSVALTLGGQAGVATATSLIAFQPVVSQEL